MRLVDHELAGQVDELVEPLDIDAKVFRPCGGAVGRPFLRVAEAASGSAVGRAGWVRGRWRAPGGADGHALRRIALGDRLEANWRTPAMLNGPRIVRWAAR